jgi:type IV pilus assembly protein PilM
MNQTIQFLFDLFRKGKCRPIGIDIGHDCVRMIQLARVEEVIRVEGAEQETLPPDPAPGSPGYRESVVRVIGNMLSRGRFIGREAVSCLPGDSLKIKSLRLDSAEAERIEELLYGDVAQRFGLDPEKDEIRYCIAGSVYQGEEIKNEVIFFGMNRSHLGEHISLLEEAGLEPVAVDAMPIALFRSFQRTLRRQEDREVVSVLVNLGVQFTTVIIGKGATIALVKQIPVAESHLTRKVAETLGISRTEVVQLCSKLRDPGAEPVDSFTRRSVMGAMSQTIENLAREISLCFKYYAVTFRGEKPSEVVFAGGNLYEAALMESLRQQLNMEIRVAEPLRGFDLSRVSFDRRPNPQMCEWAVAVGLALKGWEIAGLRQPAPTESVSKV